MSARLTRRTIYPLRDAIRKQKRPEAAAGIAERHRFTTLVRNDRIIDIVNIGLIKSINKQFC